jgi:hypothetical protein
VVLKILDKPDKPVWLVVLLALIGPSGLFGYLKWRFRRFTKLTQERLKALETKVDPDRSSSGLMRDGTNPPEDPV